MNKQEINLIGGGFSHSPSTSGFEPLYVKWIKNGQSAPISIYVDNALTMTPNPNTQNYGWLVESKTIIGSMYEWAKNNIDYLKKNFRLVFTHDVELSKLSDIFVLTQCSSKSFLEKGEVYPKTKLVSMVASNKSMCQEHLYRKEIVKKFSSKCDHFGRGYVELQNKVDGLKDYCFSITMENATYSNMFTEKITDCFMTGTIPIYYGMKNIGDFFNIDGIIILDDNFKIENLSFELYKSKIESIKDNFNRAKNLLTAEDYLYINYIKNGI
jgi:hypothetical protein